MDSVFGPLLDAMGWLMAQFYSVIPNLGVAIILLTIVIMVLLYPLTAKQAKSMIAMQRLQPEIKKLQAKHKGDRQKLSEETMRLYQENKVNPLAGCLPLLVQLPIFFALFTVLRDAYKYVPKTSELFADLCNGFSRMGLKCGAEVTSGMLSDNPSLRGTFAKGDKLLHHLEFLGIDLQKSATGVHDGFVDALPYFLLVGLVILTGYLQSRQSAKRTPQASKQMGMVMKILPVVFGLISINFPAGLVLYFFSSNLFRLGQQEVIFRKFGSASMPAGGKAKPAALDVASRDRTPKPAPTREVEAKPVRPARQPASTSSPAPASGRATSGGGLRSLFQMPEPPPDGGGARPSSGGSGGTKPPQQRSGSAKKRRKR